MKYKDYYETLGLERSATQDDIKRAYRKLARKYHPDVSKLDDTEERFKEVGEAYEVLKDPEKRAAYDRMGSEWQNGQEFQPPPNWDEGFEFRGRGGEAHPEADPNLDDFFAQMFGQRQGAYQRYGGQQGGGHEGFYQGADQGGYQGGFQGGFQGSAQMAGQDHHAKVVLDLEDAYRGAQRGITLQMPVVDGEGHVKLESRTLNVTVPKGMKAGQHLRLAGQGGPGFGDGPAGDLYLEIAYRDHPRFRLDGRDVSLDVPVAPWEAALGAQVKVPTPDGVVEITVPKGSAAGRRLRLKGKGIPGNPPGDLYVVLSIVLPPADTEQAAAAYTAMRQAFHFDPRAHFYG
ncbi:DnaJ C-terminal domain-containing protein [Paraburkholderia sp. DHOC27]|uniref:DnaJ C-terminal domain-containing protein n=1 Tax=Paraburkholderia sp. DHOC27 TaxID=2303330 RepID=UPI000E3E5ACD|nr:DnaJ C-terminal domain-containing protein [Paraburkholderia sp. DHOC27]RFU45291.1 J domain-containing protein [Paraburkholderia sp. DHOC27]